MANNNFYEHWFTSATNVNDQEFENAYKKFFTHFRWHVSNNVHSTCFKPLNRFCGSFVCDWIANVVYVELRWNKVLKDREHATK